MNVHSQYYINIVLKFLNHVMSHKKESQWLLEPFLQYLPRCHRNDVSNILTECAGVPEITGYHQCIRNGEITGDKRVKKKSAESSRWSLAGEQQLEGRSVRMASAGGRRAGRSVAFYSVPWACGFSMVSRAYPKES